MRYVTIALLLAGSALLAAILAHSDLGAAWNRLHVVGWSGVAVLTALLLAASLAQALILLQTVPSAGRTVGWAYALWKLWMVGEALNTITPLGSFGGEPLKAA